MIGLYDGGILCIGRWVDVWNNWIVDGSVFADDDDDTVGNDDDDNAEAVDECVASDGDDPYEKCEIVFWSILFSTISCSTEAASFWKKCSKKSAENLEIWNKKIKLNSFITFNWQHDPK